MFKENITTLFLCDQTNLIASHQSLCTVDKNTSIAERLEGQQNTFFFLRVVRTTGNTDAFLNSTNNVADRLFRHAFRMTLTVSVNHGRNR